MALLGEAVGQLLYLLEDSLMACGVLVPRPQI